VIVRVDTRRLLEVLPRRGVSPGLERLDTFIHLLDGGAELLVGASGRP
jgi:hypothetical protein